MQEIAAGPRDIASPSHPLPPQHALYPRCRARRARSPHLDRRHGLAPQPDRVERKTCAMPMVARHVEDIERGVRDQARRDVEFCEVALALGGDVRHDAVPRDYVGHGPKKINLIWQAQNSAVAIPITTQVHVATLCRRARALSPAMGTSTSSAAAQRKAKPGSTGDGSDPSPRVTTCQRAGATSSPAPKRANTKSASRSADLLGASAELSMSCATIATRERGQWNVTLTASVKFDVSVGFASRCQAWKCQVSPGCAATLPNGDGIAVRSIASENVPVDPEFLICPCPTKRPMKPPRHRRPWLLLTGNVLPWSRDVMKNPKEFSDKYSTDSVNVFVDTRLLPLARTRPTQPVLFVTAFAQKGAPSCPSSKRNARPPPGE